MTIYVDNMKMQFRRMKMCHMYADTHDELMDMAVKIGMNSKWIQKAGSKNEHFDICLSMREKAFSFGAKSTTWHDYGEWNQPDNYYGVKE